MSFIYRNWPITFDDERDGMIYMKCIETNASSIALTVVNDTMENVYSNTSYCGINANYFYQSNPSQGYSNGDIYTIGVCNHSSVKNNGTQNLIGRNLTGNRGTFIVYDNLSIDVQSITSFSSLSNIRFAAGGFNLFMDSTASDSTILSMMQAEEDSNWNHTKNKSAIIHLSENTGEGNNIVLVTLFIDNTSAPSNTYDMPDSMAFRQYLKNCYPDVDKGVMLDGGGSAGIIYKLSSAYTNRYRAITSGNRWIPTMITVS